jgi:hypothetical protein
MVGACHRFDPFECGTSTGTGGSIRTCDGTDEVCLCGPHRCARRDPVACPASTAHYRFVRGSDGDKASSCVDDADARSVVTGQTACPSDRRCGDPIDPVERRRCDAPGTCRCTDHRCVVASASCHGGLAYQADGACVMPAPAPGALSFDSTDANGVCVEDTNITPGCGASGTPGCASDQFCSCHAGGAQCVGFDPTSSCPGGWTYPVLGRCVLRPKPSATTDGGADHSSSVSSDAGVDGAELRPDAGSDGGGVPTMAASEGSPGPDYVWTLGMATTDGQPLSVVVPATFMTAGQVSCAAGPSRPSSCGTAAGATCAMGFCACTEGPTCVQSVSPVRCPTGLARVGDNRCVGDLTADDRHYVEPDRSDGICEELKTIQAECGGFQTDGGAGTCGSGICSCHEHRCLARVPSADCASGYAFEATGRCVERKAPSCASGLAWASDGSCIDGDPRAAVSATTQLGGARCPAAPIKRCGEAAAGGGVLRCDSPTEVCVCDGHDRCARLAPPEAACASRLTWADDGSCVEGITIAGLAVLRPGADGLCPDDRIPLPECGSATQTCPDGARCLCRERRCAAPVPAEICPSRAVWTTVNRCVGLPARPEQCASGLVWESDGSCIAAPVDSTVSAQLSVAVSVCPGFELPDAGADR